MYCFTCGDKVGQESKFCSSCGEKIATEVKNKKSSFEWWAYSKVGVSEQVDKYNELGIFKSYRGIASLLLIFSIVITWIFILLGQVSSYSYADIFILLILAILTYRGNRWAMIATMLYITISKIIAIANNSSSFFMQLIWWALYMELFYRAWKVEQLKRKVQLRLVFND